MMKKNTIIDSTDSSVVSHFSQDFWPIVVLIIIFCLAISVRLDCLSQWANEPDRAFYSGEPLLTSVDGYYYLSLSQDLLDGKYNEINEMRGVPNSPLRPFPPPLLSWLAYFIAKFSNISLNWIAMVLPVLLGSLIIFPIYIYGKKFNGRFMGVSSALFSVLTVSYVLRTRSGAFDTDCLIISLVLSIGISFWKFATTEEPRDKAINFLAALLLTVIFYFWWDQTPDVVLVISTSYLFLVLIFFYRPIFREGVVFYGIFCTLVLFLFLSQGESLYSGIYEKIISKFHYISKASNTSYPNIGESISEQHRYTFQKVIEQTTNTAYIFALSISGLIGLVIKRKKECAILLVPIFIGSLGVFYASRFLIFLTPVLALGLGFFLSELWRSKKGLYRFLSMSLFLLLTVSYHFHSTYNISTWPFVTRNDVHALIQLKEKTPENTIVWATWGKGYLINYWARRATISDGGIHSGQLSHILYSPLASIDPRFSANFIRFFSVWGRSGLAEFQRSTGLDESQTIRLLSSIFADGPQLLPSVLQGNDFCQGCLKQKTEQEWIAFLFPQSERPVVLFLHQRMLWSTYWWYWYGTWDIDMQEGVHASYGLHKNVLLSDYGLRTMWGTRVNFQTGLLVRGGREKQLNRVYLKNDTLLTGGDELGGEGLLFVDVPTENAILMDEVLWNSVFNRLFVRENTSGRYFVPLYNDTLNAQIWSVKGDIEK